MEILGGNGMRYQFLDHALNTDTRELTGPDGAVPLEPQVFDLLQLLIERRDRIVSRDDLIEAVWNGRIVSDAAIDGCINAVRKATGDSGKTQRVVKTFPRKGFRFVAPVETDTAATTPPPAGPATRQTVRFARSADGTSIAYGLIGSGTPLMRAGHWLTHLEHDWDSPIWRPQIDAFSQDSTLLKYDQRANGLSDWDVEDLSLDAFVADMKAVADAAGFDRFPIYATSQGVPVAVAFATTHPDRVSHLILHGGFAVGRALRDRGANRAEAEAQITIMQQGWGTDGSPFLQAFSSLYIPDGTREQIESLARQQRTCTSPENAVRLRRAFDNFDVSRLLPAVAAPTLVIHARDDAIHPMSQGRVIAAAIPNAEFIGLDGRNHVVLPQDPAWPIFFDAVQRHLAS